MTAIATNEDMFGSGTNDFSNFTILSTSNVNMHGNTSVLSIISNVNMHANTSELTAINSISNVVFLIV